MYDKFGVILRIETVINSPRSSRSIARATITEALHRWDTIHDQECGFLSLSRTGDGLQPALLGCLGGGGRSTAFQDLRKSPNLKSSMAEATPVLIQHSVKTPDCSRRCLAVTMSHAAFATATSENCCSAARSSCIFNIAPVRRWDVCSSGSTCATWLRRYRELGRRRDNTTRPAFAWPDLATLQKLLAELAA